MAFNRKQLSRKFKDLNKREEIDLRGLQLQSLESDLFTGLSFLTKVNYLLNNKR
jgi:hypothetical protein